MLDIVSMAEARVLVVDDEAANVQLLEGVLAAAGFGTVESTTDSRRVLDLVESFRPDVILLDLLMPFLDGFAVMDLLHDQIPSTTYLPILVLTADVTLSTKRRALASGANDFLTKPFDIDEVSLRVRNLVETRLLHRQLAESNEMLDRRVSERTSELEGAHAETFERLAVAAEYRDDATGQHTARVGRVAGLLASELGLPPEEAHMIGRAARLHDLGKIGVPDDILLAPRKLTVEEFDVIKTHTTIGRGILADSVSPLLRMAGEVAGSHHERWNGEGYAGVAGEAIPLPARVTSVADVFDALTHARPYKEAWPLDESVTEILGQRAEQFDPDVVDAFEMVAHSGALDQFALAEPVAVAAATTPVG